jgi:hypothetical protein
MPPVSFLTISLSARAYVHRKSILSVSCRRN